MEPNAEEVSHVKLALFKVTPLSKYLAMILFILMPFIGGWVGYTYAPEKIVEVERLVIKEDLGEPTPVPEEDIPVIEYTAIQDIPLTNSQLVQHFSEYRLEEYACDYIEFVDDVCYRLVGSNTSEESVVIVEDFTQAYRTAFNEEVRVLQKHFVTDNLSTLYFISFIPSSSGCCSLIKFDVETQRFTSYTGFWPGEKPSPSGRYVVTTDVGSILLRDLQTETIGRIDTPSDATIWQSNCGYAGGISDFSWDGDDTFIYGLYIDDGGYMFDSDYGDCDNTLIEHRTIPLSSLTWKKW